MTDLLALAARVEAATGADSELDAAIHYELFGGRRGVAEHGLKGVDIVFHDPESKHGLLVPFAFTQDVRFAELALPGPDWPEWQITRRFCTGYHANVGLGVDGVGCASPALALTAACLRARTQGAEA